MTRKFVTVATIALLGTNISAVEVDVKGSNDYPGVGRFAGSAITDMR